MRMQEPEQWQSAGQQWQVSQEDNEYRAGYAGRYESEQQKIHPQEERRLDSRTLGFFAIILSSIGFFLTVAGIVASAIVLRYAHGLQEILLVGGVIGLVSSIIAMLVFVAIFVIAVVSLALRTRRVRGKR